MSLVLPTTVRYVTGTHCTLFPLMTLGAYPAISKIYGVITCTKGENKHALHAKNIRYFKS